MARAVLRVLRCCTLIGAVRWAVCLPAALQATGSDSPLDLLYEVARDDINAISVDAGVDVTTQSAAETNSNEASKSAAASYTILSSAAATTSTTARSSTSPATPAISETTTLQSTVTPYRIVANVDGQLANDDSLVNNNNNNNKHNDGDNNNNSVGSSSSSSNTKITINQDDDNKQKNDNKKKNDDNNKMNEHYNDDDDSNKENDNDNNNNSGSSSNNNNNNNNSSKKNNNNRSKPVTSERRPFWNVNDDRIERDIITKILQGASQNHERARNRNLRRLLQRFQVLAFRANLSADEFQSFMRLVSEYTPSRIPAFLLRKSEREQFQEANRLRWQHIRERMQDIGRQSDRDEVIENFLDMVERDGAMKRRFYTRPRTSTRVGAIEKQLRLRPGFVTRFLAFMPLDEHPLLKQLFSGGTLPPDFVSVCCKF